LNDFQLQYFPPGYTLKLDDEIRKRTQGEGETFRNYVVAISTLIRRRGGFTERDKVDRIYLNMHHNYKLYVRRRDFVNLAGLMKITEEYETCLNERQNYRPPPNPAQALVPETAYESRARFQRHVHNASVLSPSSNPKPVSSNSVCTQTDTNDLTKEYTPRSERQRPKYTAGTDHRSRALARNQSPSPPVVCYNCDRPGHIYRFCRQPKVLKCHNCKKPGVRTNSCDCKGNEMRTSESGGHRSPRPTTN
jgi:hypothetical protein